MTKCKDCEEEAHIAGRCLKCNKRIFEEIQVHEAEKKSRDNHCSNCAKFSYKLTTEGLCKECSNLKNPKLDYKAYRKPKYYPKGYIGQCKLCGKEIYGKEGTYIKGLGLGHKKCDKAKQIIKKYR